jgi:hypothetical protein
VQWVDRPQIPFAPARSIATFFIVKLRSTTRAGSEINYQEEKSTVVTPVEITIKIRFIDPNIDVHQVDTGSEGRVIALRSVEESLSIGWGKARRRQPRASGCNHNQTARPEYTGRQ